ncbi:MAG: VOC family protein [Planctomycetota bacterium]
MKFEMLSVLTDRFDPMKRFYSEVLGFEIGPELEKYVEFTGQGVRFALCERGVMAAAVSGERFGRPAEGCPLTLAFRCATPESLDSDYKRLVERGATAVRAPSAMPWGQYAAFFADPDGHVHELFTEMGGE